MSAARSNSCIPQLDLLVNAKVDIQRINSRYILYPDIEDKTLIH